MSNLTDKKKINAMFKNTLGLVNTNSSKDYFDEVNVGTKFTQYVDISQVLIDKIPASPNFNIFTTTMSKENLLKFNIDLNTDSNKKFTDAFLENTQTIIKFIRLELQPISNSIDFNGGSFNHLDLKGNNVLDYMIPYTRDLSGGLLDDEYETTQLEYQINGGNFNEIILQSNFHGNPVINHLNGVVTFHSNPSWTNGVPIDEVSNLKLFLTFYKYVGKRGLRTFNDLDISGSLLIGGDFTIQPDINPEESSLVIQNKLGVGTAKGNIDGTLELRSYVRTDKVNNLIVDPTNSLYNGIPKLTLTGVYDATNDAQSNQIGSFDSSTTSNNTTNYFRADCGEIFFKSLGESTDFTITQPINHARIASFNENHTSANPNFYGGLSFSVSNNSNTPNLEALTIRSNSNIGINFNNPQYNLDICGNMRIGHLISNSDETHNADAVLKISGGHDKSQAKLFLGTPSLSNGSHKVALISEGQDDNSKAKLHVCLSNSNENDKSSDATISNSRMTFIPGGNIGINNQTPTNLLDIAGGSLRVKNGSIIADNFDNDNEGGKIEIISYTSSVKNHSYYIDSNQESLRVYGGINGNESIRITPDKANAEFKIGINSDRVPNYNLDISGQVMISTRPSITTGIQGGKLLFDNANNFGGPNKIHLFKDTSDAIGIGVDTSTLKYITTVNHTWYANGTNLTNGIQVMKIDSAGTLEVRNKSSAGINPFGKIITDELYLYNHELYSSADKLSSFYSIKKLTADARNTLNFTAINTSGQTDFDLVIQGNITGSNINPDDTIRFSTGSKCSYFQNSLAIGKTKNTPDSNKLDVDGNSKISGILETVDNIITGGIINQNNTTDTNNFKAHTTNFEKRVQGQEEVLIKKLVIGDTTLAQPSNEDFLIKKSSGSPVVRIDNFGTIEFTKQHTLNDPWGARSASTETVAVADWKIQHVQDVDNDPRYGDHLAFSFRRFNAGSVERTNTVLRLCPATFSGQTLNPLVTESDMEFNAVFDGNVTIHGNLIVEETATFRETIIETEVYQGGIAIPNDQSLILTDATNTSKIRFDEDATGSQKQYVDGFGDSDIGKIFLYKDVKFSVPLADTLGYHVPSSGSHRFFTNQHDTTPKLALRIDNTNNVVIGDTSDELNIGTNNGVAPSLLNLFNTSADTNGVTIESMIQFRTKTTGQLPIRFGIAGGDASDKDKISIQTSDDTKLFTVDTANKKIGFNVHNPNTQAVPHDMLIDISGGIAVNYDDNTHFSLIGKLRLGQVRDDNHVGFSHIDSKPYSTNYSIAHEADGTLHLNGVVDTGANGILFNISNQNRMRLVNDTFTIGGIGASTPVVNIVHTGTTQHTGNMTVIGDLDYKDASQTHNLLIDSSNYIKLDNITINNKELIVTATSDEFNTIINKDSNSHTYIRAFDKDKNVYIGDYLQSQSGANGKIYIGKSENVLSPENDPPIKVQSRPIIIDNDNEDGSNMGLSLYTKGHSHIYGNLELKSSSKKFLINTDKFIVDNNTGNTEIAGKLDLLGNLNVGTDNLAPKFYVNSTNGNTVILGTLNLQENFTISDSGATYFTINHQNGDVSTQGTLTVNGITTLNNNLFLEDKSITIKEVDSVKFNVDNTGIVNTGVWEATEISTSKGGLGTSVHPGGIAGKLLVSQSNNTYLPKSFVAGHGISIVSTGDNVEIINTDGASTFTVNNASDTSDGLMSNQNFIAVKLLRELMFRDNSFTNASDQDELIEGLVKKVTNYRANTYYHFTNATMKPLFIGSFLYDSFNSNAGTYNDYAMNGNRITMDSGYYDIPSGNSLDNFSQNTPGSTYRVLFWQDYQFRGNSAIDIEFHCPSHEVDFEVSNYKYNSILCVNVGNINPILKTKADLTDNLIQLNDLTGSNNKIIAEGKTQVLNDKGPRGQLFPLMGHFDSVGASSGVGLRIFVLVNTDSNSTDNSSILKIDSRSAYLKVTELTDTDTTTA